MNIFNKKCILVCVSLLSLISLVAAQATVTLSSQKQSIRGFGGMNHRIWTGYDLNQSDRDLAFGNGPGQLGFTILRMWVSDKSSDWSVELNTAKDVLKRGGIVFATPWNPPSSMTETVSRNNRQEKRLKPGSYGAYVNHLNDFNNYMKNNGVNLYAMSFANEPDWGFDWTWWSVDEVYNFTKNNAGAMNAERVITAESFSYNKSYYDKILNDANALKNIDILGAHFYGSDTKTADTWFQYPLFQQKGAGKELWMTEHYTESQNDADKWPLALDVGYELHRAMVEGQFNAYVWWYIRRDYGPIKNSTGKVSKRGYLMAQYSKYIRPGYVRVDATKNPTTDVYLSAYKGKDSVIIVAVNRATSSKTLSISIPGTTISSFTKITTSGSKNLNNDGTIAVNNGALNVTLDAQSVTTLLGKNAVSVSGVHQNKFIPGITFHKNQNSVTIKGDGALNYSIFDLRGNVVEKRLGIYELVAGKDLNAGTYVIKASSAKQTNEFKFIK